MRAWSSGVWVLCWKAYVKVSTEIFLSRPISPLTYLSANLTAFLELQQQPHSAIGANTAEGSYMNGMISGTNSPLRVQCIDNSNAWRLPAGNDSSAPRYMGGWSRKTKCLYLFAPSSLRVLYSTLLFYSETETKAAGSLLSNKDGTCLPFPFKVAPYFFR